MSRQPISWILKFTADLKDEQEQIRCLQANGVPALKTVLQYCFDPSITWLLPEGKPPYTPCEFPNIEGMLYSEVRRLYLFVDGVPNTNLNLHPIKRERMFIDLLESVTPSDAELLSYIKDKKLPYEGLTRETVLKAFPDLY